MRPLEHHKLRDVARAVTDELDATLMSRLKKRVSDSARSGSAVPPPGRAASCPPSTLMVIVWPTAN